MDRSHQCRLTTRSSGPRKSVASVTDGVRPLNADVRHHRGQHVHVPAFCDTCGTVFNSGIVVENATNITFVGNSAGPCPVCGGMGHIPDGVFNFVGNTIQILSAPQRTVNELSRLAQIIREAREKKETPEEVAKKIREELPG